MIRNRRRERREWRREKQMTDKWLLNQASELGLRIVYVKIKEDEKNEKM